VLSPFAGNGAGLSGICGAFVFTGGATPAGINGTPCRGETAASTAARVIAAMKVRVTRHICAFIFTET